MRALVRTIVTFGMLAAAAPAFSQEIVVTGSRRDAEDFDTAMPIVTMRRTADFAVQQVRVAGDTRDTQKRRDEIYAMVRGAIEASGEVRH